MIAANSNMAMSAIACIVSKYGASWIMSVPALKGVWLAATLAAPKKPPTIGAIKMLTNEKVIIAATMRA